MYQYRNMMRNDFPHVWRLSVYNNVNQIMYKVAWKVNKKTIIIIIFIFIIIIIIY